MLEQPAVDTPVIRVLPGDHDFGGVPIGECVTTTIIITDYNGRDLHISEIRFGGATDPDFGFPNPPNCPVLVPSQGSKEVEVTFCPTSGGYASGLVEISSDDPMEPVVYVGLYGLGVESGPTTRAE